MSHDVSIWQDIPDSILLHIFSFLNVADLGCVAQTCKVRYSFHNCSVTVEVYKNNKW